MICTVALCVPASNDLTIALRINCHPHLASPVKGEGLLYFDGRWYVGEGRRGGAGVGVCPPKPCTGLCPGCTTSIMTKSRKSVALRQAQGGRSVVAAMGEPLERSRTLG